MAEIHCNSIDNIQWVNLLPGPFTVHNGIHVWRVKVSESIKFIHRFLLLLNTAEKEKASAYKLEQEQQRRIISRAALRILLGKYILLPPEKIEFLKMPDHKPFVRNADNIDLHYNLSHSGDWVAIAISDKPVGIDVESIDPNFNFKELMPTYFSDYETRFIIHSGQPPENFYTMWTRKEAVLKANSKAISDDISLIPCLDGHHEVDPGVIDSSDNWRVSSFHFEESCVGSIAYKLFGQNILFMEAADLLNEL